MQPKPVQGSVRTPPLGQGWAPVHMLVYVPTVSISADRAIMWVPGNIMRDIASEICAKEPS